MAQIRELDARERPPETLRGPFKRYQKLPVPDLLADQLLVDFNNKPDVLHENLRHLRHIPPENLVHIFDEFLADAKLNLRLQAETRLSIPVYEAIKVPG